MGGGSLAIVALLVGERLTGKTLPNWAFLLVVLVAAFIACYWAWRDQRRAYLMEKATNETPNIVGSIDEVYIQDASTGLQQDLSALVLHVSLTNTTARQTAIKHYELEMVVGGELHAARLQRCRPAFVREEGR